MFFLIELIFELAGEFVLQFVFESLSEVFAHLRQKDGPQQEPPSAMHAMVGYALLGGICGGLSLWLFPSLFIKTQPARLVGLLVLPVAVAGALTVVGMWRARRGEDLVLLDRFRYAYVFALAMAAIRFAFGD